MIVHRFMSSKEFEALMQGKTLINTTNHRKKSKKNTTSVGFCFFTEDPDEAVHWLSGIVDLDYCVTMEVLDGYLIKSKGVYLSQTADVSKPITLKELRQQPMDVRTEYCRTRYSAKEVLVTGYTDKYASMYPPKELQKEFEKYLLAGGRL